MVQKHVPGWYNHGLLVLNTSVVEGSLIYDSASIKRSWGTRKRRDPLYDVMSGFIQSLISAGITQGFLNTVTHEMVAVGVPQSSGHLLCGHLVCSVCDKDILALESRALSMRIQRTELDSLGMAPRYRHSSSLREFCPSWLWAKGRVIPPVVVQKLE